MPTTYRPKVGEAVGKDSWMREDEWEIGLTSFTILYGVSTDNCARFRVYLPQLVQEHF
jgi:hypothetical protein